MGARYDGPVIDAHHHLWDASMGRHPWMTDPDSPLKAFGNFEVLRRSYLVPDYLVDAGPQPVMGSVFVEAGWDRSRPLAEEVRWVESLARPLAIAARRIAWAPLASPDVCSALDTLAEDPGTVGVRETIRWHPDPAKRWAPAGLMDDPSWRRGADALRARGMILELLMNPYQADDVVRLAREMPDLVIVVNHCGTPIDRDDAGVARWRSGLRAMGAQPNVAIKFSNFGAYGLDRSQTLMCCVEAFTPARAMFGTDYPVGRRAMTFQDICERAKDIVQGFSAGEQRALFHDTAARLYRFDAP
ncbi:MAG TPA: amidohydrolase family protein [Acetobacteraceae bacterium]|jgi:predicted TIM-barrel fold metal-dependent hydrolase|nr:amidohydrolase family protein [Acetobacteraceae bacterium]